MRHLNEILHSYPPDVLSRASKVHRTLSAAISSRVTHRYTAPCGIKTRYCTRARHRYTAPCCTKTRNCTRACLSNALPRAAKIRALSRLPVTPGGRALVFRIQYNSVIYRAHLRGANRQEQERLITHAIVVVVTLMRGGIARGKSLPGNLCVCLNDRVIHRAAVPACKYKPYPGGK